VNAAGDAARIVEPDTAAAFAAALRRAADDRQSVLLRGAGTKLDWGRPPRAIDLVLSTRRLNRIIAHQHGDLTVAVEAGAGLADVNRALAQHGQCLPLDPPFADRASVGGILAANDSGPLRHRYGTPRDLVIGVELVTTDGIIAKSGGRVVKNVAGYDLAKFVAGSFGSLAAIVSATFKLAPLPADSKTLVVEAADFDALGLIVRAVMASQLEPLAFEVRVPDVVGAELGPPSRPGQRRPLRPSLLLRFASLPAACDAQVEQARKLAPLRECAMETLDGAHEREAWEAHSRSVWEAPGVIVRASWLPAEVSALMHELRQLAGSACIELIGRAAVGTGLIRIDADVGSQVSIVTRLRRSQSLGNVVILRGSQQLKTQVDVWGDAGDLEAVFASLKRALDPDGILNAERGPI
jgi:glycolate oxidase FAD binding subunit